MRCKGATAAMLICLTAAAGAAGASRAHAQEGEVQEVPAQAAQPMPLGQPALPPAAFLDFCRRQPADCGADAADVLRKTAQAQAELMALFALPLETAAPAAIAQASAAAASAPATASAPAPAPSPAPASAAVPAAPRMDRKLKARLQRANDAVNRAMRPQTDQATYGVADYWATPLEAGRRFGDCEDYVLEKERALIAEGLSRDALAIATVMTPAGESHAVLLVNTSLGEYVLDNLAPKVRPWRETGYRFLKRQRFGRPFEWVMAGR